MEKIRILLIVQPERVDFYNYLSEAENVEWVLLWYERKGQMYLAPADLPINFHSIFYWTQFSTPSQLLKKIKPYRIIFFEIIDLRQIALIVTASANKIPTFYLEHGAANDMLTAISRWKENTFIQHKFPYFLKRLRNSFLDIIKAKFFYYTVTKGFKTVRSYRKYFLLPFKMLATAPNKVLSRDKFRERVPEKSIVFNEVNYEQYAVYTGIIREEAMFTGVPFFDQYYKPDSDIVKDHIVYIDHPYLEEQLLNWTPEHHQKLADALFAFAEKNKVHLYIKLHPRSKLSLWEGYRYNKDYVSIIQAGDFTNLYLQAKLILGFSSSLITGFLCAKKNVVLLGWHPKPSIFGTDFSKTGLCYVSFSQHDLSDKYSEWLKHNLSLENEKAYQDFLLKFNYPFDGKATQRIINAIVNNGTS